jgi:hypothetical protein
MTFSPRLPFPVAMWDEHPLQLAAGVLTTLAPYKTTAGYWVLAQVGSGPAGSTRGAAVHGASYDTLTTSTPVGLRHTRNARGVVFSF